MKNTRNESRSRQFRGVRKQGAGIRAALLVVAMAIGIWGVTGAAQSPNAGLDILRQGGNAIDAAVAAGAVLDVTSQNDAGIGGDLFALVYVAKDKKLYALNSAGWAPAGWTPEFFTETLGVRTVPRFGVNARTEPGAISGYDALLKRFGTMHFKETFERAASVAEEGWGQAERRHRDLRGAVRGLLGDADSRSAFLVGDQAPDLYSIVRNPGLARALRAMQQQGRDAFYKGEIAAAIVGKIRANGGVMSLSDLAEFQSEWVEPISTNYHGYDVFELPPPGQGFAALEMLNILEVCVPKLGMTLSELGPSNPRYWHLMVEAKKLAYADLLAKNADPKFAAVPVEDLLSKTYTATLCSKISPNVASKTLAAAGGYQGILFTRDPQLPEPTFDRRGIAPDLPVNGVYRAGSDHRKDGQAVGW